MDACMKQHKHILYSHLGKRYCVLTRGEGVYVFDESGKRYLDAIGGVCVANIGHGVPEIVEVLAEQARTLAFAYGSLVDNRPRQQLADKLQQWAPHGMGETRTLFSSGGAEANEGALKLTYQYHWERRRPTKRKVIGRWQSYHGNTIGALSMSGRTSWRVMHSPYLLDFPHIPPPYCYRCPWDQCYPGCGLPCAYDLLRTIRQEGPDNVAAFIAEPIIGTSMSALVPPPEYYQIIREICDEHDILFIVDEVMSGVGRTGKRWAIEHWGVVPDIITSAKGLSGGYAPLGAVILAEKVWSPIASGSQTVMHSCTYGGNPLSCAVGVAVLKYIEDHSLVQRADEMGHRLLAGLQTELGSLPHVGEVRGKGLFVGVELVAERDSKEPFPPEWNVAHRVEEEAFERGLLILSGATGTMDGVAGDHIELVPPYTVTGEHLDFTVSTLREAIQHAVSQLPNRGRRFATGVDLPPECLGCTDNDSRS